MNPHPPAGRMRGSFAHGAWGA